MYKPNPEQKKRYNQNYMGQPGSERRKKYLASTRKRNGEIGSEKREKYNIYHRMYRKTH